MSNFDPAEFMNLTVDQPLEMDRTLVPEGEYQASIDDFDQGAFETFTFTYKKGQHAGEEGQMHKFNCPVVINDDAVKQKLNMEKVRIYQQCTLDLDENGALMWGPNRNIDLGKLRHATKQNAPGAWSIGNLRGAGPFMIKVQHRTGKRKDGTDFKVAEIVRYAPIS